MGGTGSYSPLDPSSRPRLGEKAIASAHVCPNCNSDMLIQDADTDIKVDCPRCHTRWLQNDGSDKIYSIPAITWQRTRPNMAARMFKRMRMNMSSFSAIIVNQQGVLRGCEANKSFDTSRQKTKCKELGLALEELDAIIKRIIPESDMPLSINNIPARTEWDIKGLQNCCRNTSDSPEMTFCGNCDQPATIYYWDKAVNIITRKDQHQQTRMVVNCDWCERFDVFKAGWADYSNFLIWHSSHQRKFTLPNKPDGGWHANK